MTKLYSFVVAACVASFILTIWFFNRPQEYEVTLLGLEDGKIDNQEVLRVSKIAILRSGVSEDALETIPYQDEKLIGTNSNRPNRFISSWKDGCADVRYSVYVSINDRIATCKVVRSK
ncbi:hypothetical protein Q31b_57350 [Novipirellula aureliae]|uniref:Uncharacterized protein n=1 Tax=Novipirellula aureliae TaxID=2527966 RepID=A0A5C6DAD3_9BACT|nr:hypothetical protein Q31b_57350 [Novipirellula aureliae]